ncbi:hypothetical protein Salmuc_01644 [Salipiger mucosus DSM 16094]|uniref:Uncharacterized protein n=1 Tax=Salipiger mucosus DSM 16094 TaxID=1123237 RepID=S9SCA1_9RHOB|nr:hypothetical protein Salmuc_01644 [Salipiger mucosus DSM 16094]
MPEPSLSGIEHSWIDGILKSGDAEFRNGELRCKSCDGDCRRCGLSRALGTSQQAFLAGPMPKPPYQFRDLYFALHENEMDFVAETCLGEFMIMPYLNHTLRLVTKDRGLVRFCRGQGEGSFEAAVVRAQQHLEQTMSSDLVSVDRLACARSTDTESREKRNG